MLETQLRNWFMRWVRGGDLRPVVVVTLLAALFIAFPDRDFSLSNADAAPSTSPACASGVGVGAPTRLRQLQLGAVTRLIRQIA